MKPGLLALDFDGVVCDGIAEMVESLWRTVNEVAGPAPLLSPQVHDAGTRSGRHAHDIEVSR